MFEMMLDEYIPKQQKFLDIQFQGIILTPQLGMYCKHSI